MDNLQDKIQDMMRPKQKTIDPSHIKSGDPAKKVVFVSKCMHRNGDFISPINPDAEWLFRKIVEKYIPEAEYQVLPAIYKYDIDEDDLTTSDYNIHRPLLMRELEAIQPDLIIPLGNVALRSVTKQQGITTKRGCELFISSETTNKVISVIPTLDEHTVYLEPTYHSVFIEDIRNAYNKVILYLNKLKDKNYVICDTMELVKFHIGEAMKVKYTGCDTETTGLNFQEDVLTCFGCSYAKGSGFVIPLHHFESPFTDSELEEIFGLIGDLHACESVMKIYANVKFDLKFLIEAGVTEFNNCHDIQFMHSLIDENRSHKLSELSKKYFPLEVETF